MLDDIQAWVYHVNSEGTYYVKLDIQGIYISDITVKISPKYPEKGLWVQMPSYRKGVSWKKIIEFNPDTSAKRGIETKALQAVEDYKNSNKHIEKDQVIDDIVPKEEFDKAFKELPY